MLLYFQSLPLRIDQRLDLLLDFLQKILLLHSLAFPLSQMKFLPHQSSFYRIQLELFLSLIHI